MDRYRRFAELTDEEIRADFKEQADERREAELSKVVLLDLTTSTADELPHPAVAAAISFAAKRALNQQPDALSSELRDRVSAETGIDTENVAVGPGADGLMAALVAKLVAKDEQILIPWPSYRLHPLLAGIVGAQPIPLTVPREPEAIASAANAAGRAPVMVLTNPNDPDGHLIDAEGIAQLRAKLTPKTVLIVDEALIDYAGDNHIHRMNELVADTPGLFLVRSMSKAWGLSGLKVGWVLAGPGGEEVLQSLTPLLGVPAPSEAGALAALDEAKQQRNARVAAVSTEKARLEALLRSSTVDIGPSDANLVWASVPGIGSAELAAKLRDAGVLVRDGAEVGEPTRICAAIRGDQTATDRLAEGLLEAAGQAPSSAD
ncbi:MAG: aminotransferase class I/II-fold pyridoxal phosphate-dependent enzyme [Actinomycetes bacterium]